MTPVPSTGKGVVIAVAALAFLFVFVFATGAATILVGGVLIAVVATVAYYIGVNADRVLRNLL